MTGKEWAQANRRQAVIQRSMFERRPRQKASASEMVGTVLIGALQWGIIFAVLALLVAIVRAI